jgi:hypothetical protein
MDHTGMPVAQVKVGQAGKPADRIRAETAILQRVSSLGLAMAQIPKLIGHGARESWEALIEEHVADDKRLSRSIDAEFVTDLHVELHGLTALEGLLEKGRFWRRMVERLGRDSFRDSPSQLLEQALTVVSCHLGRKPISLGLAHRDIASWNFLVSPDKVTVIDWEMASDGCPPLVDLFHFLVFEPLALGNKTPERAIEDLGRAPTRPLLDSALHRLGSQDLSVPALVALYLVDRISVLREEQGLVPTSQRQDQVEKLIVALEYVLTLIRHEPC